MTLASPVSTPRAPATPISPLDRATQLYNLAVFLLALLIGWLRSDGVTDLGISPFAAWIAGSQMILISIVNSILVAIGISSYSLPGA